MPRRGSKKKNPVCMVHKALYTAEEHPAVAGHAKRCGMTVSKYLRQLSLWDIGLVDQRPSRKKNQLTEELIARLAAIHADLKRYGNNANQLAHQANAKIVPITGTEAEGFLKEVAEVTAQLKQAIRGLIK